MKTIPIMLAAAFALGACGGPKYESTEAKPKLVMFVGVDQSGSFEKAGFRKDSLDFLSQYLYAHLNGLNGLEKPHSLFVGPIGGMKAGQPRTFHPIQDYAGRDVEGIRAALEAQFPAGAHEARTDYDAFFVRAAEIVTERNLVLRPISLVMATDGMVDAGGRKGKLGFKGLDLNPLERLSRSVSLRLLYTTAESGAAWRRQVPRKRVRVWTQDAEVMAGWRQEGVYKEGAKPEEQAALHEWIKGNVDFGVRASRVN